MGQNKERISYTLHQKSERGTTSPEDVIAKGRVGPGEEILAVDTETGEMLAADDIDHQLKVRQPYKKWLREQTIRFEAEMKDPFSDLKKLTEQQGWTLTSNYLI